MTQLSIPSRMAVFQHAPKPKLPLEGVSVPDFGSFTQRGGGHPRPLRSPRGPSADVKTASDFYSHNSWIMSLLSRV